MGIMDDVMRETGSGEFIKGKEFEAGLTVKFVAVSRITASDAKYGDDEGKTIRYALEVDGIEKVFDNTSKRLQQAIRGAAIEPGDMALMKRSGVGMDTEWDVEKLGKEV